MWKIVIICLCGMYWAVHASILCGIIELKLEVETNERKLHLTEQILLQVNLFKLFWWSCSSYGECWLRFHHRSKISHRLRQRFKASNTKLQNVSIACELSSKQMIVELINFESFERIFNWIFHNENKAKLFRISCDRRFKMLRTQLVLMNNNIFKTKWTFHIYYLLPRRKLN